MSCSFLYSDFFKASSLFCSAIFASASTLALLPSSSALASATLISFSALALAILASFWILTKLSTPRFTIASLSSVQFWTFRFTISNPIFSISSIAFSCIFCENNCLLFTKSTNCICPIISRIFPSSICWTLFAISAVPWFKKCFAAILISSGFVDILTFATASTSTLIKSFVGTLFALTSIWINFNGILSTLSKNGILIVAFPVITLASFLNPDIK